MKSTILKTTTLSLIAAALIAAPAAVLAQDAAPTNAPAASEHKSETPTKHNKKHDHSAFNGKLSAIDASAMTFTVGERTFEVTSETKITKDGKPATLADVKAGEMAGGSYKKGADGKLTATTVHFTSKSEGGKSEGEKQHKKKDSSGSLTNSVPN